eukprot:TRINITY_DN9477_c0_g1_i2.p1 TRINITY_DN9477_c0_g1~~TRINITY_DN9477_c0_g1_i2.p1  ORF type:complete len:219 (-),score=51.53 TRINITY_DN9477_c0_g1_i2:35-691(-)
MGMILCNGTDQERLCKQFSRMYEEFLEGLASPPTNVEAFPLMETQFLMDTLRRTQIYKNSGLKINVTKDEAGFAASGLKRGANIFEIVHLTGVNVNRAKNMSADYYLLEDSQEQKGLLQYVPQLEEEVMIKYLIRQIVLRVYVQVDSPYLLEVRNALGKLETPSTKNYTHILIFETQVRTPPMGTLSALSPEQYLKWYRPGRWPVSYTHLTLPTIYSV